MVITETEISDCAVCRRTGGGFGGKVTRSMVTAAACAVAAHKLEQPVFYQLDRNEDLRMNGGMLPALCLLPPPDQPILLRYQQVDPVCKSVTLAD